MFNSEVWHSLTESDIEEFVEVDKYLLKGLISAHDKTPVEHLYLETAALPIPYILTSRRIIYLKNILDREDEEITKKIYKCQVNNPVPGDWCELVSQDFNKIEMHISEKLIEEMPLPVFKKLVKSYVRNSAFKYLEGLKDSHNKVKENKYKHFSSPQEYITSKELSNTQISILFSLRSRSIRGIKENFKNMHKDNTLCPICERFSDSQEHLLQCQVLQNIYSIAPEIKYSHIYGTIEQQKSITEAYETYLSMRDDILGDTYSSTSLPGLYTGPQRHQARTDRDSARSSTGDISC